MTHRHEEMTMKPELEMTEADGTCEKIKCDGHCAAFLAIAGSQYCFFHDPATAKARKAAQRQGGEANGSAVLPADAVDVPLRSGKDVSAFLAETINQVRKGQVSPKIATTVGYLSSLLMKALETTDIEERLARIEQVLKMRGAEETLFNPDEDEGVAYGNGSKAT
jgi:hypothetical protein